MAEKERESRILQEDQPAGRHPERRRGWPSGPTQFELRYGNAVTRILVGIVAIPLILWAVWAGDTPFWLLVLGISTGALLEFYWLLESRGFAPLKALGVFVGAGILPLYVGLAVPGMALGSLALMLAGAVAILYAGLTRPNDVTLGSTISTLAGLLYIPLLLGTLLPLRSVETFIPDATRIHGAYLIGLVMVTIWICDSAAYYGGKSFGRRKLAPTVSPNKTVEGGLSGLLFALLVPVLAMLLIPPIGEFLTAVDAVIIGLAVGLGGQAGDLVESQLKRAAGIKDSSAIIPGHGGVLDRFDSLIMVAPLVYLWLAIRYELFPLFF